MEQRIKNPDAVALGKLGGPKGGKARAEKLSPEERSAIARKGGKVKWSKKRYKEFLEAKSKEKPVIFNITSRSLPVKESKDELVFYGGRRISRNTLKK